MKKIKAITEYSSIHIFIERFMNMNKHTNKKEK